MKITIDTKEDSHEEIRRAIKMLSSLVGDKEIMSNQDIFEDSSPEVGGNVFGNMFSDASPSGSGKSTNYKDDDNDDEEPKDQPEIMVY